MTKVIHHGVINKKDIEVSIKKYGFKMLDYNENNEYIKTIIEKDYAKSFNIDFNGMVKVECIIMRKMYDMFCVYTYPKFKEISNLIPKKAFYHMYEDGSICYAPPKRPLVEKWNLEDFISSIDSFFHNYFSIEYIGKGELFQLEHGEKGLIQYEFIYRVSKK